jgi:hypothetical protein
VHKFEFDDNDLNSVVFKLSKSMGLKLSETGGTMTAAVHVEANDSDTASQISAIAQGLVAVLKLQKTDPDALKLANSIVIKQDGSSVGLTLSKSSSELVDMIKNQQKKEEQKEEKEQDTNSPAEKK